MQQSKLIEVLRKLNSKQLSRFEDFLLSPYFNKNEENLLFFKYLRKFAPAFEHKRLEKKEVILHFYKQISFDEKSLAYLMNRLLRLLEEFLSIEEMKSNDIAFELNLMKQYYFLGLPRHEKSIESRIEKKLNSSSQRNARFYQQQFLLRYLQYEHSDPNQRAYDPKLQDAANALDIYFVTEKLRYACQMKNLSNMLNFNYKVDFAEEVANWIELGEFEDNPTLQVYKGVYQILIGKDNQQEFDKAKSILIEHGSIFTSGELKQLYTLLLNHCTRQINQNNDEKYWHEYLEINKLLLEKKLMLENGELPPWRYTNLVTVGLRTGQLAWTKQFIDKYRSSLPAEYAENLYHYNLAQLHFHQKEFDKAQTELIHVVFNDVLLNLSARSLLIKIYFETEQLELLLSYLEATRIFLIRNKVLDEKVKSQMKKFVEICGKLAKVGPEKDRFAELLDHLPPASEVLHRDWLEEKIEKSM